MAGKETFTSEDVNKAKLACQHALDRLKDKFPSSVSQADLFAFTLIGADRERPGVVHCLKTILERDKEVRQLDDGTYSYKPPYDIRSEEALLQYFQKDANVRSIEVAKLKKGWPECDPAIDKLEGEHKLIVLRNKKDSTPRVIFADDPSLHAPLDQDFVNLWMGIQLPQKDDLIRALIQARRTPAGQVADNKVVAKVKTKVRKTRQSAKQTNKHINLFRDYSALKKGK